MFSLNTWAQQSSVKPRSNPEPIEQVRQEFLSAYNAKDADAVVALYAKDAMLVSDGGTFEERMRFGSGSSRDWIKGARWKQSSQPLKRVHAHSPTRRGEREG
jgi:hypothetical protein